MDRWRGKVAVITGAAGGIGSAVVKNLLSEQLQVVAIDNRAEPLEAFAKSLQKPKDLFTYTVDITKDQEVVELFQNVTKKLGPVHILINCAGIVHQNSMLDGDTETWKRVLEVNVLGLCITTREAVRIMRENNIDGHIIQVCSVAGHSIIDFPDINIYPASKFAVRALAETYRQELRRCNLKIKITNISPGKVNTEIADNIHLPGIDKNALPSLEPKDIADAMTYVLSTPPHVQVHELMIRPIGEQF